MQTYIFSQDSSPKKLGVRRQMPQASLPSLNVAVSAPAYTPLTPTTPGSGIMPSITRENLAARLRQNWLAQNPVEQPLPVAPAAADDSLTSLSWLQNLNIMKMASPTPPASPQPAAEATTSAANTNPSLNVNPNAVLNMDYCTAPIRVKQEPGMQANVTVSPPRVKSFSHDLLPSSPTPGVDTIDYKTDARVKPHHSYADLIAMAMENSGKKKITLAGIYSYITENFLWYKNADISWQNSIRHNLSLNKSFLKVPRKKEEPGKGGFWKMNPECEHQFKNSSCKKRRGGAILRDVPPPMPSSSLKRQHSIDTSDSDSNLPDLPPAKRVCVKREPSASIPSLDSLNGDYTWNSLLSQDITVGDQKVKTEAIIDGDADIASSITEMSPPPSEGSNTDEIFDLLSTGFSEPLDFTTGQPLDLSINGTSVSKPNWWDDSLTTAHFRDAEDACGLHTPQHEPDTTPHPWAESDKDELDSALACFDPCFDTSLFTVDNLSSQHDL